MKAKVFVLLGDGGYLFSLGMNSWAQSLRAQGYDVEVIADSGRDTTAVARKIIAENDRPIALVGYSLGGNGVAWVARTLEILNYNEKRNRVIDLAIAVDPTKNGPSLVDYALGKHVLRAISFKNTGIGLWSPTSWFFGGSVLVGPQVEVIEVSGDHLMLQFSSKWRTIAERAIELVEVRRKLKPELGRDDLNQMGY